MSQHFITEPVIWIEPCDKEKWAAAYSYRSNRHSDFLNNFSTLYIHRKYKLIASIKICPNYSVVGWVAYQYTFKLTFMRYISINLTPLQILLTPFSNLMTPFSFLSSQELGSHCPSLHCLAEASSRGLGTPPWPQLHGQPPPGASGPSGGWWPGSRATGRARTARTRSPWVTSIKAPQWPLLLPPSPHYRRNLNKKTFNNFT